MAIRSDSPEMRPGGRSSRPDNLKESAARTADQPAQTSQPEQAASPAAPPSLGQDQVHLLKLDPREEKPARGLPDLSSWGETLADTAGELAKRAVEGGKALWEETREALGFDPAPAADRPQTPPASPPGNPSEATPSLPAPNSGQAGAVGAQAAADASKPASENPAETAARPPQLQGLPPRPEEARGGKEFMESIKHLKPGPERDEAILDEVLKGNIPDNLRDLKEVNVTRQGQGGQSHQLTMHVMPDYLSIGSNEDNVRIPMTPAVAQAIADRTGTSLPTDRMVDDIHSQADRQLHMDPFQWKPGNEHARHMQSIDYYQKHDQRIDSQLGTEAAPGQLLSGHKKDLVIPQKDGQVAIYGGAWPGTGKRVQPYSNLHEKTYEDYSHGARLVSQEVLVDGRPMKLSELLADPELAPLVTRFPPTSSGEPAGLRNRYDVPDSLR